MDTYGIFRPTWHGTPLNEEESRDIETIITKSGLDYTLEKESLFTSRRHFKGKMAVVRQDTWDPLSVVSDSYNLVQPREVVEFFKDVVDNFGWSLECCGEFKGGRVYWAMANTGFSLDFLEERMQTYVLLISSCDKSVATVALYTNSFLRCWNVLHMVTSSGRDGYYVKAPHSREFDPEYFKSRLGLGANKFELENAETIRMYEEFSKIKVGSDSLISYFAHVSGKAPEEQDFGTAQWDEVWKSYEDNEPKHPQIVANLMKAMEEAPGQKLPGRNMTLWGALNAVTYWTDHMRGRSAQSRGFNVVNGTAEPYKQSALSLAKEMIGL